MAERTQTKKTVDRKSAKTKTRLSRTPKQLLVSLRKGRESYLARRPHRTFQLTRRRDYARSLELPGYWSFTNHVRQTLWFHRKLFLLLGLVYALLTAFMIGVASQSDYTTLTDTIKGTSGDIFSGNWGAIGQASLLFLATITGGVSASPTDAQKIYAGLLILMMWLTTVWLLRNSMAGHKAKLRDGLYNAGAPILSTFLVGVVLVVQLLPLALAVIGYSAASSTGLLATGGVAAMVFWIAVALLATLSLYWVTSTFIALIIVTLPGMYPLQAIRAAGDLVIGRRLRILLRLLWMVLGVAVTWIVVMLPIILVDTWLKDVWSAINWVPTIPVALLALSSLTIIWIAGYIYLLYRKVVDDGAQPA